MRSVPHPRPTAIILMCLALTMLAAPRACAQDADYAIIDVDQDSLSVRAEPGDFPQAIGSVQPGQCVTLTGQTMEQDGASWVQIASPTGPSGWYDRTANRAYDAGWVPAAAARPSASCNRAHGFGSAVIQALLPGLEAAAARACEPADTRDTFVSFTLNHQRVIRWLVRLLDNSVVYEFSDFDYQTVTGVRTPQEMVLELIGIPFTMYTVCDTGFDAQLSDTFTFSVDNGDTPARDRLHITMNTGTGRYLTLIFSRHTTRFIGTVERGWKITGITLRPLQADRTAP